MSLPHSANFMLLYLSIALLILLLIYLVVSHFRAHPSDPHDGLSRADIAALPTFKYCARAVPTTSPSPQRSSGGNRRSASTTKGTAAAAAAECVICLQELADGDVVRVLPACRHFFHGKCIYDWLRKHSSCPVCRAYPEPERALRPGEAAQSPPLPQLRPFDVSLERRTPVTRIFAGILAWSPLKIRGSTSGSNERIASRSLSPSPVAREYVLSRSPSRTPLTGGMVDEPCSSSSESPQMLQPRGRGGSVDLLDEVRPLAYDDVRSRVGEHGCERAVVAIPPGDISCGIATQVPN